MKKWNDKKKLEYDLKLGKELCDLYSLITKLVIVAIDRNLKLVIENPYSTQSFLTTHWCIKPAIIDKNRRNRGDYQIKPTQFFFINYEPKHNFFFEPLELVEYRTHNNARARDGKSATTMRSMIHPQYANRFIREFILEEA